MAIKRLHYFNGQFLKEQDFSDEQKYHLDMRRRLNQRLHAPGIVFGLEVNPGANKVTVQPGMAIDPQGREIILEAATDLTITAAGDITIAYKEEQTDESSETGVVGKRRWTESCVLANAADPNGIVLAKVSTVSPVALNNAFRRPYSAPVVLGDLEVKRDVTIQGNLTVQGETTTVQTEKMRGNVVLGDEDGDTVTVEGRLLTGHSSNRLQIGSPLQVAGDVTVTGPLTLPGNPTAALHAATKQYIGDTMSGALSITAGGTGLNVTNNASVGGNIAVGGNIGVGTTQPAEPLDVNGRVKSGSLSVGPWPTNSNYMMFGVNTLNQSAHMNYALLQGATSEPGRTFLNSPVDIRFRIGNTEQMILANNGNVGIGTITPNGRLDVANLVRFGLDEGGSGPKVITFARDGSDEINAGKIAFKPSWDPMALGIVGAGTIPNRKVRIWDDLVVDNEAFKPGGGSWTSFSDKRLKTNVKPLSGSLNKLLKLRGVSFQWKEPEKYGKLTGTQVGLVADEVEEIFPDWVGTDSAGYKTLTIRGFEALTIEALRELQQANEELRSANSELQKRLKILEQKLAHD
jgi:Chaperone of endosialidase